MPSPSQDNLPLRNGAPRQFWCFISYRHLDNQELGRQWATWLHQTIETYQVPEDLVGQTNNRGEAIPERIFPVFRDEESLAAGADLTAKITNALDHSKTMVLLCSPKAVESGHVRNEIAYFKKIGKADRIVAAILYGSPHASRQDTEFPPELECFPDELCYAIDADDNLLRDQEVEPLAADLRIGNTVEQGWTSPEAYREALEADGTLNRSEITERVKVYSQELERSRLKILAGILGRPLGELTRRDKDYQLKLERKRARRLRAWLAVVTVLAAVAVVLGMQAHQRRLAAEAARDDANNLVGFMLDDLQPELETVGRIDALEGVVNEVDAYLSDLGKDTQKNWNSASSEVRMRISRASILRSMGRVSEAIDELANAVTQARNASRLAPSKDEGDALLATALLRFGDVLGFQPNQESLEQSRKALDDSVTLLKRLSDSGKAEFTGSRIDLAEAYMYLGDLHVESDHQEEAIAAYDEAIALGSSIVGSMTEGGTVPGKGYQRAVSNLLRTMDLKGRVLTSSRTRFEEVVELGTEMEVLVTTLLERQPKNVLWRAYKPRVQLLQATALLSQSKLEEALPILREAEEIQRELVDFEPDNADWKIKLHAILHAIGKAKEKAGDLKAAGEYYKKSREVIDEAARRAEGDAHLQIRVLESLINLAEAHLRQNPKEANSILESAREIYNALANLSSHTGVTDKLTADLLSIEFYSAQAHLKLAQRVSPPEARKLLEAGASHARAAVSLIESQADHDSGDRSQQFSQATVYSTAGQIHLLNKQYKQAKKFFLKGQGMLRALIDSSGESPDPLFLQELARSHGNLGILSQEQDAYPDAVHHFTEAIYVWDSLEEQILQLPRLRNEFAKFLILRAKAYRNLEPPNLDLALQDLATARELCKAILKSKPDFSFATLTLTSVTLAQGGLLSDSGRYSEAIDAYRQYLLHNEVILRLGGLFTYKKLDSVSNMVAKAIIAGRSKNLPGIDKATGNFIDAMNQVTSLLAERNEITQEQRNALISRITRAAAPPEAKEGDSGKRGPTGDQ